MAHVSEKAESLFGSVYALSDPRHPTIPRYVGLTKNSLRSRLGSHIERAQRDMNHPLSIWINEIMDLDLFPKIYLLEKCEIKDLQKKEEFWIQHYRPLGILLNKSNGVGMKGLKVVISEKNRQATIARNKLGHTKEVTAKLMASKKKFMKPVEIVSTGEKFESIRSLSRVTGISPTHIKKSIKNNNPIKGLRFQFVGKESESVSSN